MIINNNISAMGIVKNLKSVNNRKAMLSKSLSCGLRINSASDDAAGMAISQKMKAQIRGLQQASRNIQDSISLLHVAESAMEEIQSFNQRLRELAVQAANETLTDADLDMIMNEVGGIKSGIDDVVETTEFNGKKLLRGDYRGYYYGEVDTNVLLKPATPSSVSVRFPYSFTVVSGKSDTLKLEIDGAESSITLSPGAYNINALTAEINDRLSGSNINAFVTTDGGTLTFNHTIYGANYKVDSISGNFITSSSILTTQGTSYPATVTQGEVLASSTTVQGKTLPPYISQGQTSLADIRSGTILNIIYTETGGNPPYAISNRTYLSITTGVNDELTFKLDGTDYTIKIPQNNYYVASLEGSPLLTAINEQFNMLGISVVAKMAGYAGDGVNDRLYGEAIRFELTDDTIGAVRTIGSFGGNARSTLFDTYVDGWTCIDATNIRSVTVTGSSARITGTKDLSGGVIIDNTNNQLDIEIDGQTKNIMLNASTYTADQMVAVLNSQLNGAATASLSNNKLVITNASQGNSSTIGNVTGSTYETLFENKTAAKVTGVKDLSGGVVIYSTNNQLDVEISGVPQTINLVAKTYSASELITALNLQLGDAAAASLDNGRLVITTKSLGDSAVFNNIGGSAYETLFCTGTSAKITGTASLDGIITIDSTNNELSMDINGLKQTIALTEASYNPGELIDELNSKLTGVTASLDPDNKLIITSKVQGSLSTISNITGNAFETLFIKRTAAYIEGRRDLSGGVTIDDTNKDLSIDVDGTQQNITLTQWSYTPEELLGELNLKLKGATASWGPGNRLIITAKSLGDPSTITNVLGSTVMTLFAEHFSKKSGTDDVFEKKTAKIFDQNRAILSQIGANAGNIKALTIERLDSSELGYDEPQPDLSSAVNARSAINMIDEAIGKVSTERSKIGAASNSLEYMLNNVSNYAINLTEAESRISDADMAREMIEYAKTNILSQVAQAMLAQANQQPQGVLQLLR